MSSFNRSRRTLIIVFIAFLLPVLVAWLILDQHWYQAGTNKGTLLTDPIALEDTEQLPQGWKLGYIVPANCEQQCANALYVMNQIDVAVGKDSDRVFPIAFSDNSEQQLTQQLEQLQVSAIKAPNIVQQLSSLPHNTLFIIDPLNNVMLYYPTHKDKESMVLEGKNVLADLRKLLKLSRIG